MSFLVRLAFVCCWLAALVSGCGGDDAPPPVERDEVMIPREPGEGPVVPAGASGQDAISGKEGKLPEHFRK
jgi:hypothetical protein